MQLHNLMAYCCDDVRYKRKNNPDAWTTADNVNGAMFCSYPLFEFIPGTQGDKEPKRYGDFVIDIDTEELSCGSAIKIIDYFTTVYGIEYHQWRIMLSGKKGVHLELPATILGTDEGHIWLPLAYKRLAIDIEGELQVKLDTSMYNKGSGKPFRQPNIMRDTGTCKRQIEFDDLYEITDEEEYKEACKEPGPVWEPEDVAKNGLLSNKIAQFLKDAEREQERIKETPQLTDDERDRLALNIPPCISKLAHLHDAGNTGNTFNDVAIQLTAYAVTAGYSEIDFLSAASDFIENYPSSSLNTHDKRYENCRARYRTMAANGNNHSCGGILALKFPGFDCGKCEARPASAFEVLDVMTAEDLALSSMTLDIPEHVLNPGGLISLGMKALSAPGMPDIPQYNLPVVLTAIARAISGRLIFRRVWPNLFNIKIGPTSSGKSTSDSALIDAVEMAGLKDFFGLTDFASGPALMRSLSEQPVCMVVIDEATSLFRRYNGKPDAVTDGKREALLELFSSSGKMIKKAYSDTKKSINIEKPCLSITGNVTPVILDDIQQEDFNTGLMQRFDFWTYDGPAPYRDNEADNNPDLKSFANSLKDINNSNPAGGNMANNQNAPLSLGITEEANKILSQFSHETTEAVNVLGADGEKGIVSRRYDLAIKYSIIHLAAMRSPDLFAQPIDKNSIEYGIAVAKMLSDWKLETLKGKVTTGEFHRMCEVFKNAIEAVIKMGQRPTFKTMANRRPELKNWKRKDSDEIIQVLVKRGEIKMDDSKTKTAYLLSKE